MTVMIKILLLASRYDDNVDEHEPYLYEIISFGHAKMSRAYRELVVVILIYFIPVQNVASGCPIAYVLIYGTFPSRSIIDIGRVHMNTHSSSLSTCL
jgi:hypothetical protein